MYKQKLLEDLKLFLKYIHKTRLTTGIPSGGYKPEEYKKFPPNTVSHYWDYEDVEIQTVEALIQWAETGVVTGRQLVGEQAIKIKINTLHSLILEPNIDKYDSLFIANVYRGIEILLALQVKKNCKTIYCTCLCDTYEKLIKEFFSDQNIALQHIRLCVMPLNVFKDNSTLMICNGEGAHGIAQYINDPKITRIIKEGKIVDQSQPWENHNWLDTFDKDFISLQERVYEQRTSYLRT
jgi:hypothetical protein